MLDDPSHIFTVVSNTAKVAIVVKVPAVAHSRLVSVDSSFAIFVGVVLVVGDTVLVWMFLYVCVFLLGVCNLSIVAKVLFCWGWLLLVVDRRLAVCNCR